MSLIERLHSIRDLHNKLVNPPNGVPDYGIDLKRKKDVPQIVEPEPQIEAVAEPTPEPQPEPLPEPYRVRREFPSPADITAVVLERFPYVSLARITTPMSCPQIGKCLGGRDHTTSMHSHNKIGDLVQRDAMVSHDVNE